MTTTDPSTCALKEAISTLDESLWLRNDIIAALAEASKAASVASFYHLYFSRLTLALDHPEDAELVEFLSSRMLESEEVVNAHVEEQRDHLRHTIHDSLLGYLFLNATPYFHPIAESFARRVGYRGDSSMSFLNYAWFLAAHFHDLGYPVEFHHYLLNFVRQIVSDFPHVDYMDAGSPMTYRGDAPLASLFAWRASLYGSSEDVEEGVPLLPARAVREQVDRRDHALTAAFLLWDRAPLCESGPTHEKCFTGPVLRTGALACASHNFQYLVIGEDRQWFRISLTRDPVSFLLQLVDEVQDWSRERVDIDMLWAIGVPKHRYLRAILCGPPSIMLDEGGRLLILYGVAVQPFLDDPRNPYQLLRAREHLERNIIERSRNLSRVLKIDWKPGVVLEGRYRIGPDTWPSNSYEDCFTPLAVGERQPKWKCQFGSLRHQTTPGLEPAGAVEVADRQIGARIVVGADGNLQPKRCKLGEGRIWLDSDGKITVKGLHGGTMYLLIGAGGVGKSTLLRHVTMRPSNAYSAFYMDVIPPEGRGLDLEQTAGSELRLFLVDHFDHVLTQRQAEYWKGEIAQLEIPGDAAVILACRTEVAEQWPYTEGRRDKIRVLETYRRGHVVKAEDFVQEKLGKLQPPVREELADLAFQKRGERWIPVAEVSQKLRERVGEEMLRPVWGRLRFDHDYVQDSLATLGILRAISQGDEDFDLGQALVMHPPWVYGFLLWSLCGQRRGVSPFLDLGREAYLRLRCATLDRLLRSNRALQWLEQTGGSEVGATGEDWVRLPIQELEEVLTKESNTVHPAHIYLVQELAARHFQVRWLPAGHGPSTEAEAKKIVELCLRYRDFDKNADRYLTAAALPTRFWVTRRQNNILTRAYAWSLAYGGVRLQMEFWKDWGDRWEKEKVWIENAPVDQPLKDYWLAVWLSQKAFVDFQDLVSGLRTGLLDRKETNRRLEEAIRLAKRGIFHRRRAIERGTGNGDDGYETLAQGLGDQAMGHRMIITSCWQILELFGEDEVGTVRMTVEFDHEIHALWERARRALRPNETLSRYYASCARTAAYAAAIRAFRSKPARPFYEVEEASRKAFNDWLKAYPFEATRDPLFEGESRKNELERTVETIKHLEGLLRNEAQRWTGKEGGENGRNN